MCNCVHCQTVRRKGIECSACGAWYAAPSIRVVGQPVQGATCPACLHGARVTFVPEPRNSIEGTWIEVET